MDLLAGGIDPRSEKSKATALLKRNEGNVALRARNWLDALELYGDSLRFAQPKSEHISLAYANRAASFLSLKLYDICLTDIQLAKEAGYPEHLMLKLDQRKANCLQQMHNDPQPTQKLSFEPNDPFPWLASKATMRKKKNGGYSVVATSDIDVGEIIVVEEPFQAFLAEHFGTRCSKCLNGYGNLVPCVKCTDVMFCAECRENPLHGYECGLNLCAKGDFYSSTMPFVRGILRIVREFPVVDDLTAFIEQSRENPNEFPANLLNQRSKYQILFNQSTRTEFNETDLVLLFAVYKTLLPIPHVSRTFQSANHRRFFLHLIGHQMKTSDCVVKINYGTPTCRIGVVMQRYLKHSCNPNVGEVVRNGKPGEELCCCRVFLHIDSVQGREK